MFCITELLYEWVGKQLPIDTTITIHAENTFFDPRNIVIQTSIIENFSSIPRTKIPYFKLNVHLKLGKRIIILESRKTFP